MTKEKLVIKTIITEEVVRENKTILKQVSENLTPNVAIASFIKRIGGDVSSDPFIYIALGTGTTPANTSDTALEAEISSDGLARAGAVVSYETLSTTGDTLQLQKSFTATGSKSVTEIGVFNDASAGVLGGRVVKTAVPLESNDVYNITYQIVLSRAN